MAITLDELLGRNQNANVAAAPVDRFPSYDDYTASRRAQEPVNDYAAPAARPAYNFESRPYTAPRSVEAVREYEASRPYEAPRFNEYRNGGYNSMDAHLATATKERTYASEEEYNSYLAYNAPAREEQPARNLYEFTVNDRERKSDEDLYGRLSMSGGAATATMPDAHVQRESYAENYVERYREQCGVQSRKRMHLGLKAKLLIAAYLVVVVLVSVLIIVNAKPLNNGTAKVPSSSAIGAYVQEFEPETANNPISYQIEFGYEIR